MAGFQSEMEKGRNRKGPVGGQKWEELEEETRSLYPQHSLALGVAWAPFVED